MVKWIAVWNATVQIRNYQKLHHQCKGSMFYYFYSRQTLKLFINLDPRTDCNLRSEPIPPSKIEPIKIVPVKKAHNVKKIISSGINALKASEFNIQFNRPVSSLKFWAFSTKRTNWPVIKIEGDGLKLTMEKSSTLWKYNFEQFRQNGQTNRGQTDRFNCSSEHVFYAYLNRHDWLQRPRGYRNGVLSFFVNFNKLLFSVTNWLSEKNASFTFWWFQLQNK